MCCGAMRPHRGPFLAVAFLLEYGYRRRDVSQAFCGSCSIPKSRHAAGSAGGGNLFPYGVGRAQPHSKLFRHEQGDRRRQRGCIAEASVGGEPSKQRPQQLLPSTWQLRSSRIAALVATVAAASFCGIRVGHAASGMQILLAVMAGITVLQSVSVGLATEAATKGVNYKWRNAMLWGHALLGSMSAASLFVAIVVCQRAVAQRLVFLLTQVALGTSLWALVNGAIAFGDPRKYPGLLQRFLVGHYGSAAKGKSVIIKGHRLVGVMAYTFATIALAAVVCEICRRDSFDSAALAIAVVAFFSLFMLLQPSAIRGRYRLPRMSLSRSSGLQITLDGVALIELPPAKRT